MVNKKESNEGVKVKYLRKKTRQSAHECTIEERQRNMERKRQKECVHKVWVQPQSVQEIWAKEEEMAEDYGL